MLIFVVLVPCAVAALVAFGCERTRFLAPIAWAAGSGCGYIAGQLGLAGRRGGVARAFSTISQPHEAADWLPLAVLLALGVTVLATYAPRAWQRWTIVLAALLTIGLPLRLLAGSSFVTVKWSALEKLAYIALLAATLALTWLLLASARYEVQSRLRAVLLIVVAAGSAVVVALSGVLVYGQLCGLVAAALVGTALALRFGEGLSGTAGVVTASLGSILILAAFYGKLAPSNAVLLFLALVFAAGRLPEFITSRPNWQPAVARCILCLVPLTIALARAILAAQASLSANPYAA